MKIKKNKSAFLKRFGDSPKLRVWDFLIENHFWDYPRTEIARESNISYNSFINFFPQMVKDNFVIKTRRVGKSDFYKLNIKNPQIKLLIKFDWALTKKSLASHKLPITVKIPKPQKVEVIDYLEGKRNLQNLPIK